MRILSLPSWPASGPACRAAVVRVRAGWTAALPVAAVAIGAAWAATPVSAQQAAPVGCQFLAGTGNAVGSGNRYYVSSPRIRCRDGRYMEADSMVSYGESGYFQFIGRVFIQDRDQSLRARDARYYEDLGRLEAEQSVVLTDRATGNVLRGDRLLMLRERQGRPDRELTMTGDRPTATLYPPADTTAPPTAAEDVVPYDVEADRIYLRGDRLFQAQGNVEVERDSLTARGGSMDYDREAGQIVFQDDARVNQGALDITGDRVLLSLPEEEIEEVTATGQARLLQEDLDVDAHQIRIFLSEGELDRLVAVIDRSAAQAPGAEDAGATVGPPAPTDPAAGEAADSATGAATPRAVARSATLVMTADSLDVTAPAQTLERVVAIGDARAVSTARDSLNTEDTPEVARTDWIEGDTVVAAFAPDTATVPEGEQRDFVLERLEARVNARSLYRLDPDSVTDESGRPATRPARVDTAGAEGEAAAAATPADSLAAAGPEAPAAPGPRLPINFVVGREILIQFRQGEIQTLVVTGLQQGIYASPRASRSRRGGEEEEERP